MQTIVENASDLDNYTWHQNFLDYVYSKSIKGYFEVVIHCSLLSKWTDILYVHSVVLEKGQGRIILKGYGHDELKLKMKLLLFPMMLTLKKIKRCSAPLLIPIWEVN